MIINTLLLLLVFATPLWTQDVSGADSRTLRLASGVDASSSQNFTVPPLAGSGSGVLHFRWASGGDPPNNCDDSSPSRISVVPKTEFAQTLIENSDVPYLAKALIPCNVSPGVSQNFVLKLPYAMPSLGFRVFYVPGGGVVNSTFDLTYIERADGYQEPALYLAFPPLTSTTPLSNSNSCTLVGTYGITTHSVELQVTGAPATCTFVLEGTNGDGINFLLGIHNWFDLSGAQTCTSSVLFHVVNKPVMCIRPRLTALTGGTNPAVRMWYYGVR